MREMRFRMLAISALAAFLVAPVVVASDDDKVPDSVTVSFGRGLNTAQPGNSVNHHILPKVITVHVNGVVNFAVAGFHWIRVYDRGTKPADINLFSATGTTLLINDPNNLLYDGINPGGPTGAPATFFPRANAQNRVESYSFPKTETYLVICNIRPHFLDGMFAFVNVVGTDDENDSNIVVPESEHSHHH